MSNVLLSPSNSTLSISNIDQKITLNNNQEVNINGKAFIVSSIDSQSAYPDYAIMFSKSINPTSIDDIYSLTTIDGLKYIQNAVIGSIYVVVYFKSRTSYENYYVKISISNSPYAYVHPFVKYTSSAISDINISTIILKMNYNYILMTDEYLPQKPLENSKLQFKTTFTYINYNSVYPTYLFTFDSNKTYHMMTKDGSVAEETDTIILVNCPTSNIDLSKLYIVSQNSKTTTLTDYITIDETITNNLADGPTNKITYFEFGTVAPTASTLPLNIKHISYGETQDSIQIGFAATMTIKDNILKSSADAIGLSFYDENNHQLQLYDNIDNITNLTSFNFGYYDNRTLYIPKCDSNLTVYVYSHNYISQPNGDKFEGFAMYIPDDDKNIILQMDTIARSLRIQDNYHVANKDVIDAYDIKGDVSIYYINGLNEQFEFTLENNVTNALYFTTAFTPDANIPENARYIFNIKNILALESEEMPSVLSSMRFTNANDNTFSLDTISASGLKDYDVLIPIYNYGTMLASSFDNANFIVYNNGTVSFTGSSYVNYIDMQTNQALSLVGNNTSIQNNLNTLWTHLQPNIDNNGVKLHSLTPNVITMLNNSVVSVVNDRLEELTKTNNNNIFIYSVSTDTIPWIVKTSETDPINRAIVYRDVNNIWYIAGNGGWYEFNGHDYANKTTTLDVSDGVKHNDGIKGLWYKHRWLGWFATDENDLLTIGEYSFRYYRSSVMANMFLIVL